MRRLVAAVVLSVVLFGAAPAHASRGDLREIEEMVGSLPELPDGCIVSANVAGVRICI